LERRPTRPPEHQALIDAVDLDGIEVLHTLGIDQAREWLEARCREELLELCGPEGTRDPKKLATRRHGAYKVVKFRDREIPQVWVPRVVVKATKKSIDLPFYTALSDSQKTRTQRRTLDLAMNGVTTRGASRVAAEDGKRPPRGQSKSNQSRFLQREMTEAFKELFTRPLDELPPFAVAYFDGTELGGLTMLVGFGVTEDGTKVPFGVIQGQTEDESLVKRGVQRVVRQGADLSNALWVIDGGSGLRKGIRAVFGPNVQLQNCVEHVARTVAEKLPTLLFRGVNEMLSSAINETRRQRALTRGATLERLLTEAGYPAAGALIRQRVREVSDLRRELRGRDQERVQALIENTMSTAMTMLPRSLWVGYNAALHRGWKDPNPRRALKRLRKTAGALAMAGYPEAAKSVLKLLDEQVTASRLGVTDPELHAGIRTNNPNESLNALLRKFTEDHHTQWRAGAMRMRWMAAKVLEVAERRWNPVGPPEALRPMSLNNLKAQHPGVKLRTDPAPGGIVISGISVAEELRGQGKADAALRGLLQWANRRGLTVGVTPRALAERVSTARLADWFASYGFVANTEGKVLRRRAMIRPPGAEVERTRQPPERDPLEQYRSRLGEVVGAQLGNWTLEEGAEIVAYPDRMLHELLAETRAALQSRPSMRDRLRGWRAVHGDAAVTYTALQRLREPDGEASVQRYSALLGEALVRDLQGRASERADRLRGGREADIERLGRSVGDPFGALEAVVKDWMAESGRLAAREIAVRRELSERAELATVRAEVQAREPTETSLAGVETPNRLLLNARRIGSVRTNRLAPLSAAWAARMQDEETAVLLALRKRLGDPFAMLDPRGARATLKAEHNRPIALMQWRVHEQNARRLGRLAAQIRNPLHVGKRREFESNAAAEQATANRAGARVKKLDRLSRRLRSSGVHLDSWMGRYGDLAARVAGIDYVLSRRKEQELAMTPGTVMERERVPTQVEAAIAV
jgi:transposase-like protein